MTYPKAQHCWGWKPGHLSTKLALALEGHTNPFLIFFLYTATSSYCSLWVHLHIALQ